SRRRQTPANQRLTSAVPSNAIADRAPSGPGSLAPQHREPIASRRRCPIDGGCEVSLPCDSHVHSEWSWDTPVGDMEGSCARALELGLPAIAFTEHLDNTVWRI